MALGASFRIAPAIVEFEVITFVLIAVGVVGSAASLVVRFRRATGEERQQIKWLALAGAVAAIGFGLGLSATASGYGALGVLSVHGPLPLDDLAVWIGEWTFVPPVYGGVVLLLYLFPDGHFISARWRWTAYVTAFLVTIATSVDALAPGPLEDIFRSTTRSAPQDGWPMS